MRRRALLCAAFLTLSIAGCSDSGGDKSGSMPSRADGPATTRTTLLDDFDRAHDARIGNGWVETEIIGAAAVSIKNERLAFVDTSNAEMRPVASLSFGEITHGVLTWEFDLDWTKTGSDTGYSLHMQLGDGARMSADSVDAGVGVNLVWSRIGLRDQMLGYRRSGATTALAEISGPATIRVDVDLAALAYDVRVDGVSVATGVPFELPVALNTVRFLTDDLDELSFSGRTIDAVSLTGPRPADSGNLAPSAGDAVVRAADGVAKTIALAYTDHDGPGAYTFDVIDAPRHGALAGDDGDATVLYTPNRGFVGNDRFTFRVHDGLASSKLATISVSVQHYPSATWESRTPAQLGLDAEALDRLAARVGGVGSIVRHGYMAKTWGDQGAKADWASTAKPVLNTLLFFAAQEKRIDTVEDPVANWVVPATGRALQPQDESMTFMHLMNMTSGYARIERPAAAWAYNDVGIQLNNRLIGAIFGEPLDARLRERLAPLQLEDGPLLTTRGGYGVSTTTRDFARIAWFWMNRGNWRGEQVLGETFFDEYMKTQVPGSLPRTTAPDVDYLGVGTVGGNTDQSPYGPGQFGMSWWFNDAVGTTGRRPWPDAPLDMIQAHGHWGDEMIVMIPSFNLVVASRGDWGSFVPGDRSSGLNERLRLLSSAVVQ